MICTLCEGKGIVPADLSWRPGAWDGGERRQEPREESEPKKFEEVNAPLYVTCGACTGMGRILPGLQGSRRAA